MSNYLNLLGLPYVDGKQDCYSVVRNYYWQVWGLEMPNFARPTRFWEAPDLDLYRHYQLVGFQPVLDGVFQEGDGVLMPVMTPFNSHAGVIVEDNRMLHHLPNQLSAVDDLRPKWINRITVHLRHPSITAASPEREVLHLHEVIDADILRNPKVQEKLEKTLASDG